MKNFNIMLIASLLVAGSICANAQESKRKWINKQIKSMTLRRQIAQLFITGCYPERGEEHVNKISNIIRDEQIGGIIWGECSPAMYVKTLNRLQSQANIPLLITIDAEWGIAMRLDSVVKFPQQLTLGAIQDNGLIYEFGAEVAEQCRKTGIHFNFAPVVDINSNPDNPVINMRSFGENKYKVTEKAYSYMKGMQDGGILTSLKHFPGHGDTDKDSHKELPTIAHDKKHINDNELYPFRELIKRGATGVMTAHLRIPALFENDIPASQSKEICTGLLQKKLKFKGLTVTDALEMKGALHNRDTSKVALYSLMAGNNILEIPVDVKKSIDEIEKAVINGEISKRYIRKNCKKILAAKYDLGLHKGFSPINPQGILERLNTEHAKTLRMKLAEASLTLLSNKNILPLNATKVKYIEIGNGKAFKTQLEKYCKIDTIRLKPETVKENIDSIAVSLSDAETVIIGYHNTRPYARANFGMDTLAVDFIDSLTIKKNIVLVFFGNPYAISKFKNHEKFAAIIVAYDNSDEAQICSANAIFGKQKFKGKLPVSINEKYREDFGITY